MRNVQIENVKFARPLKSLGQNFLINKEIAIAEAVHSNDKNVLELGPGYGILTEELCKRAKKVIAVEKDSNLCKLLAQKIRSKKLKLIDGDFFKVNDSELELDTIDIMISNIPYNLSSKTIGWLSEKQKEAVLCLQKEFVEHMLAKENTDNYSKLSVICTLCFSITKIMTISRGNFRPIPRVDSTIIYIKPRAKVLSKEEGEIIGAIMQHKKRTVRNAIICSHAYFKKEKDELATIADSIKNKEQRVFKMNPNQILELARELSKKNRTAPVSGRV